ncbi:MAG: PqqD family protein [Myxococcales bacterium]|nr:PqqD family protein [Myxococcales bacterium]
MGDLRVPVPDRRIAGRLIGDRALVLDPRDEVLRQLNATGSFIWACVAERQHTVDAIIAAVVETFEVEPETAADDVRAFLERLAQEGLITLTEEG